MRIPWQLCLSHHGNIVAIVKDEAVEVWAISGDKDRVQLIGRCTGKSFLVVIVVVVVVVVVVIVVIFIAAVVIFGGGVFMFNVSPAAGDCL